MACRPNFEDLGAMLDLVVVLGTFRIGEAQIKINAAI
jgi:hypothetical protein